MSQFEREASTMNRAAYVIDKNGVSGAIENNEKMLSSDGSLVLIRAGDGSSYLVLSEILVELKDGGYFLPIAFRDMTPHARSNATPVEPDNDVDVDVPAANPVAESTTQENVQTDTAQMNATPAGEESLVVPVIAEELQVVVRAVERGRVRITKTVSEREEIIDEPLRMEDAVIERVEINRIVETAPPVRYEGDVMIVSLVEEIAVVEKKLMLREELHVSKRVIETHKPQSVVLRREEVGVEHVTPAIAE